MNGEQDDRSDSEQFNLYYENNSKELIQQGIIKRREQGIGVGIINICGGTEMVYITVNDMLNTIIELKNLILNDNKRDVSLYLLLCNNNGSKLFVHELV